MAYFKSLSELRSGVRGGNDSVNFPDVVRPARKRVAHKSHCNDISMDYSMGSVHKGAVNMRAKKAF